MNKIDLSTYKLYCKYNGQAQLEEERTPAKPKDVYENIGVDFNIISTISNNLFMIKSGHYSSKLIKEMERGISELKIKVTDEVFKYIDRNENIFPESELKKVF